jgi:hypothetical protein
MGRWLARLAYSFLILAGLLFWEGYKQLTRTASPQTWRIALYFVAAGISVGLAVRGIQERHRGNRE